MNTLSATFGGSAYAQPCSGHRFYDLRVVGKLPINTFSRTIVDAEGADERLRPYLVGSAVALIYRERKFLVTIIACFQ
jgi:hypothetical protein